MSCAQSPENGFHRFRLAATGTRFETACVYCGTAKVITPYEEAHPVVVNGRRAPRLSQLPPIIGRATRL